MELFINNYIHINDSSAIRDGKEIVSVTEWSNIKEPAELYRSQSLSYMKFFKMDILSKWAWLGAEILLNAGGNSIYKGIDKSKIAVVLQTGHGCLDVDKKYRASMDEVASPALFVYTLPNIMLGEICIRHGFKGEQLCMVSEQLDTEELTFWVDDLLNNRGMKACLCGWVDAYADNKEVSLFWVTKDKSRHTFTEDNIKQILNA